jgi:hypothetical protein
MFATESTGNRPAVKENGPGYRRKNNSYKIDTDIAREKPAREIEAQRVYDAISKIFNDAFHRDPWLNVAPISEGGMLARPFSNMANGQEAFQDPAQANIVARRTLNSPYKNGLDFRPLLTPDDTPESRRLKLASPARPRGIKKPQANRSPNRLRSNATRNGNDAMKGAMPTNPLSHTSLTILPGTPTTMSPTTSTPISPVIVHRSFNTPPASPPATADTAAADVSVLEISSPAPSTSRLTSNGGNNVSYEHAADWLASKELAELGVTIDELARLGISGKLNATFLGFTAEGHAVGEPPAKQPAVERLTVKDYAVEEPAPEDADAVIVMELGDQEAVRFL